MMTHHLKYVFQVLHPQEHQAEVSLHRTEAKKEEGEGKKENAGRSDVI